MITTFSFLPVARAAGGVLLVLGTGACGSATRSARTASVSSTSSAATTACFDTRGLTAAQERDARAMLLELADGEGLYTVAGGLKPISSDFNNLTIRIKPTLDKARLDSLARLRDLTARLTCGNLGLAVEVFTAPSPGRGDTIFRVASVVAYDRAALRRAIERHADYFATLGVTPNADAPSVIAAIENAERGARWRGYGYAFGYPDHAVDFFVDAGLRGDSLSAVVPRDFIRIETFRKFPEQHGEAPMLSSFVYAVPKGAPETTGDRELRERAAPIYAEYIKRRARWVGATNGIIELLREWVGGSPELLTAPPAR